MNELGRFIQENPEATEVFVGFIVLSALLLRGALRTFAGINSRIMVETRETYGTPTTNEPVKPSGAETYDRLGEQVERGANILGRWK